MRQLFTKIPTDELKSVRLEVRASGKDALAIRELAFIRCLSVSEFMRRTALGRRADVHFEVEIILSIREVVQSIRGMQATFITLGFQPHDDKLGRVLDEALAAMLRISK